MSGVQRRIFKDTPDDSVDYDDVPSSYEEAEQITGFRLDHRKRYMIIQGEVCELCTFTRSCSGCFETEDGHPVGKYPYDHKAGCHVGAGCEECGFTGKRVDSSWVEVMPID